MELFSQSLVEYINKSFWCFVQSKSRKIRPIKFVFFYLSTGIVIFIQKGPSPTFGYCSLTALHDIEATDSLEPMPVLK